MNYNRGFLNNKFGIFNDESDSENLSAESDDDYSGSVCFDASAQIKSSVDSKPNPKETTTTNPVFYPEFKHFPYKNKKYKRRSRSSIQKVFKSLGVCCFFQTGSCNRGTKCSYAHQLISLKHINCKYFQQGRCKFGERCVFDHPSHQLHISQLEMEIQNLVAANSELQKINTLLQKNLKKKVEQSIKPRIQRKHILSSNSDAIVMRAQNSLPNLIFSHTKCDLDPQFLQMNIEATQEKKHKPRLLPTGPALDLNHIPAITDIKKVYHARFWKPKSFFEHITPTGRRVWDTSIIR
jgi:Zinc finger C-x8-C-x5-C-x3-H type (and similar)